MSQDVQSKPIKGTHLMRRITIPATLLLVAFLLGFVPMWWKSRECSSSLSEAEHQLSLARQQNALASAVIEARSGDYEPARKAASDFFTSLRTETNRGDALSISPAQTEGVPPQFTGRDELNSAGASGTGTFELVEVKLRLTIPQLYGRYNVFTSGVAVAGDLLIVESTAGWWPIKTEEAPTRTYERAR